MPWKETRKVKEREEMMEKLRTGLFTIEELAEQYGVSRPTVYLWKARSEAGEDLLDRPPIAKKFPHATDRSLIARLIRAKKQKPHWGPFKQRARLIGEFPSVAWPAVSTIGDIYEAHGLVKKRRKRRKVITVRRLDQSEPTRSGEMMSCDHKGWFRLGSGRYCYPLTINDPFSRYIYAIDALESTSVAEAKPVFIRVLRENGVPEMMLSDNGGPFCCTRSLAGLWRLSVSWIKQGIQPVRIRKGCPWENGIHERMHRTLKAETTRPASRNPQEQQKRFDAFRQEFNFERPHEALAGQPPVSAFQRCRREYSEQAAKATVEYAGSMESRSVRSDGCIKFQGRHLFLTESLTGERVGLEESGDGTWTVNFGAIAIARYDERTHALV